MNEILWTLWILLFIFLRSIDFIFLKEGVNVAEVKLWTLPLCSGKQLKSQNSPFSLSWAKSEACPGVSQRFGQSSSPESGVLLLLWLSFFLEFLPHFPDSLVASNSVFCFLRQVRLCISVGGLATQHIDRGLSLVRSYKKGNSAWTIPPESHFSVPFWSFLL